MARPIIGVTGPDEGGAAAWWFTRFAVWLAGGHAVRITPRRRRSIGTLHGLILGGGADVDPELYGQNLRPLLDRPKPPSEPPLVFILEWVLFPLTWLARTLVGRFAHKADKSPVDPGRDAMETRLLDEARVRGLPVLGICRGMQLINVRCGGTLHQSLVGFYQETGAIRTILPRKRIELTEGTRLAELMGFRPHHINALHRQGIDRLAPGLVVAARDRHGVIQAIERPGAPLLLGVQWHPEYLPQVADQRRIFEALVKEASGRD